MAIAAPVLSFVTVTVDTITVALVAPIDPLYDHMLVRVYDTLTGALVHASGAIAGPTYTTPVLTTNRSYVVSALAVDTGGEYSLPANQIVVVETNAHNDVIGDPRVVITAIAQESRTKVRIEYRLEDAKDHVFGELVNAEYSFNGTFSDAQPMQESTDARHSGRFFVEFREAPMIVNPQHYFIWDITEIPDNTVHEYSFRFRGKSGALYSTMVTDTVDIDTTEPRGDVNIPTVVLDNDLLFHLPAFNGQAALTGATVTVTEIRDDTDTDLLGGPVVAPALATPNDFIYEVAIPLPSGTYPAGRYRVYFTVTGVGYSSSGSYVFVVVPASYDINFALGGADLCLVYGKLVDNLNRPVVDAAVRATYTREPSRYDRVSMRQLTVYTNEHGFFAMHLLRGSEVVLEITELDYAERVKVPAQAAVLFSMAQHNQPSTLTRGNYGHVIPPELP